MYESARTRRRGALPIIVVAIIAFAGGTAGATPGAWPFENDGDFIENQGGIDWTTCADPAGDQTFFPVQDELSGSATDRGFGQGTKDDDTTVTLVTSNWPGKNDLLNGGICTEQILVQGVPTFFGAFYATRRTNTGAFNLGVMLHQLPSEDPPLMGTWNITRTAGDVFLQAHSEGAGTVVVRFQEWVTAPNGTCAANISPPCWSPLQDLDPAFVDGALNEQPIDDPFTGEVIAPQNFFEFSIDFTGSGLVTSVCEAFSEVLFVSRSSHSQNAASKDLMRAPDVLIQFEPDVSGASAERSAFGLEITESGNTTKFVDVSTSQIGEGRDSASDSIADFAGPDPNDPLVRAALVETVSVSEVTASPARAQHTSIAEILDLAITDVLTADVLRSVATATARPNSVSVSGLETIDDDEIDNPFRSAIQGLSIDTDGPGPNQPQAVEYVAPNTTIDLEFPLSGHVKLNFSAFDVTAPDAGTPIGTEVTFAGEQTTTMIEVQIDDTDPVTPGDQPVTVVVSFADAFAAFPTFLCDPAQEVSGDAFIVRANTDPSLVGIAVGEVSIPKVGGHANQALVAAALPEDKTIASTGTTETDALGSFAIDDPTKMTARSFSYAESVCLLPDSIDPVTGDPVDCLVRASVLRAQADAESGQDGIGSVGTFEVVGLEVAGNAIAGAVPPNTVIDASPVAKVILNQQVCDGGAALNVPDPMGATGTCGESPVDPGRTGITVTGVVVVLLDGNPLGAEPLATIEAFQAHADAKWIDVS